ncbi:unnamed protein product [Miscanthus lutarioriparius]|uniref:Uncharacterized protein n=1 Tax=Miscanthus lutarioriparius TaxID=422564 RepID=A0A811RI12_9POAL|nr:unnamed protein product [Miscanthus lutarioriparius]
MASGLRRDETKPRRFDLTMSRRTRRPAAATSATSCHEQDHQAVDVEGLGLFQPMVQPEQQDPDGLFCLSDHLQSRQPEDAHQEHETSVRRSEDTKEQASPLQTCRLVKKDDESEAQQQQEECQDNSRRFSLQELIEDEAVDGVKDAATGGTEENAAVPVREVAEGAAAGEAKRPGQVPGRRVMGIMRRYVKVRSIKPKRASPENTAPFLCFSPLQYKRKRKCDVDDMFWLAVDCNQSM